MKSLTKASILAAEDLRAEPVEVPQWGGTVYVRCMTAAERDLWDAELLDSNRDDKTEFLRNMRARLCVRVLVDEKGIRLFDDDDAEALGQKSSSAVDAIFDVAQKLNGLSDEKMEDLKGN